MLDFWETLGRVVANENGLRDTLFKPNIQNVPNVLLTPNVPVYSNGAGTPEIAIQIQSNQSNPATNKYKTLFKILQDHTYFRPLSLFCQSEWLRALPLTGLQQALIDLEAAAAPNDLAKRSAMFYAGLGAIVSDDSFASDYAADPNLFPLLPSTSTGEVSILVKLAGTVGVPNGFMDYAAGVCNKFWPPPCFVVVEPYSKDNQLHPTLAGLKALFLHNFRRHSDKR
jgi:hypothetical protein